MRKILFLTLASSLVLVMGCSTEPHACAAVLTIVTANVTNRTGQSLADLSVTDTLRRIGAVLHILTSFPDTLPADSTRVVPIFPDTLSGLLEAAGDDVIVAVTADDRSASAVYRLGFDGCFVQKLAGPDTLVMQ